ncbi:SUMF1/EgtB/PvdO family nonheme iron enzyme [bacterium]|nr:SUMF1/EgtB/PvdO family nonheme iron enzyme [bacterium]
MWTFLTVIGYAVKRDRRTTGSNRVKRGGSWNNNPRNLRCANRNRNKPGNRNNNLGFRLLSTG